MSLFKQPVGFATRHPWWPAIPIWMVIALLTIFQHGPMPMYSTRSLSVAWEMWHRHSFLVPYLNGAPYSDKPPLLFWLIQLGWGVTGVSDTWPRVLEVALGATELWLAMMLGRRLFPGSDAVARATPWLLMAFSYGFLFGLQTMYEVLLANCVLLALLALLPSARRESPRPLLFALALAAGLLTKGPVMLLHVAFPWLLGPLWNDWARRHQRRWYLGGLLVLLAGLAALAAWALPASRLGGAVYREQLLFHQTAGRVVDAFAHAKPFWWYLPILWALIFPFSLWPGLWLALARLGRPFDPGMRFLLCWLAPVLLAFSLISGKQAYYLLPEFAGFALLLAAALVRLRETHPSPMQNRWLGPWPLALLFGALGVALLLLPWISGQAHLGLASHRQELSALWPFHLVLGLVYLMLASWLLRAGSRISTTAAAALLGVAAANAMFTLVFWPAFDLQPAADLIARAQSQGRAVANLEKYDGQFHFLGRLTAPITSLASPQEGRIWAAAHPSGMLVTYTSHPAPGDPQCALYFHAFRGVWMGIWSSPAFLHHSQPDPVGRPDGSYVSRQ
ncbi:MAG: glycosyltransferase family 39 protein [Rhodanobacter sp.]|jgi:4-amino-4-deoxy-L-arabinose transferase-like glycosyltransferase